MLDNIFMALNEILTVFLTVKVILVHELIYIFISLSLFVVGSYHFLTFWQSIKEKNIFIGYFEFLFHKSHQLKKLIISSITIEAFNFNCKITESDLVTFEIVFLSFLGNVFDYQENQIA